MTKGEDNLLRWAGELGNATPYLSRLSSVLLSDREGAGRRRARSTLNNDGSPLQVCATYGRSRRKLRIIGDPAAFLDDPQTRLADSCRALARLLALTGSTGLADGCNETLRQILPSRPGLAEFDAGIFWLAAGLEGGAALYVNTRWGELEERWRDAARWLQALLPDGRDCEALIRAVRPYATLASVGLEGRTPADARAKLYWRLTRPVSLDRMGVSLLSDGAFNDFLSLLLAKDAPLSLSGLVFSAGFSLADGTLRDVKIDVCAHCLPKTPAAWAGILEQCRLARGLLHPDVADGLLCGRCELAFVGFGVDTDGDERLNVYLKTPGRDV